ncbi:hypothetical protein PCANC_04815 [Puccinia coronata f. sp. avenae]|uniref:Uncharacterized protein n=1 Tax=Puccinia coronata f. sp. avenae TaxID=200324 RepID=A0A2N5W2M9_9BASI|nr:hypothetical protein PCANC_04815 [Puccinia coronata f. sp. avenae]
MRWRSVQTASRLKHDLGPLRTLSSSATQRTTHADYCLSVGLSEEPHPIRKVLSGKSFACPSSSPRCFSTSKHLTGSDPANRRTGELSTGAQQPSTYYHAEFERAQSDKNIIRILELCQELKQRPPSQEDLKLAYRHLVSILGHYGLWTQVYATVNELLELVPLHHMDDQLWATIVDAFTRCNRSTDVVYSLIISTGQNNMGPLTITALLRAAILQSNLSQSLFLLQTASTSALLPLLPKISLIQLAASLAEQAQLPLAQDLVHSFVIPITANDHPDCIRGLVSLLRTCVNRSDPQSTLYYYSYLTTHHGEAMEELLDDGLIVEMISLSSRHIMPDLTLNVLSQMVRSKRKLETVHLFPAIIALSRSGDKMVEAVEMVVRAGKLLHIGPPESELLRFSLMVGHLGGLHAYRHLVVHSHPDQDTAEKESWTKKRERAVEALDRSKQLCKELLIEKPAHHPTEHPSSAVALALINSLIQADLELGRPAEALATFKTFFQYRPSTPQIFQPDCHTLTCLTNAAEQASDDDLVIRDEILSTIHHLQRTSSEPLV